MRRSFFDVPQHMEEPVPCAACGDWVELEETYRCENNQDLRCKPCWREWKAEADAEEAEAQG